MIGPRAGPWKVAPTQQWGVGVELYATGAFHTQIRFELGLVLCSLLAVTTADADTVFTACSPFHELQLNEIPMEL